MTAVQQAIYFAMLGAQATSGPLPTDLDELAWLATRHTRDLDESDFHKAWCSPLIDCFVEQDGCLINERMAMEVEAAEARSARARKAIEARWSQDRDDKKADSDTDVLPAKNGGNTMTGQTDRTNSTDRQTEKRARARTDALASTLEKLEPPAWVGEVCTGYQTHRRDIKAKALSGRGWAQKVNDLVRHGESAGRAALALSISNGWTGLFPEKCAQTSSHWPSRGGFYRGPALKDVEARTARRNIADRYRQMTGNILLEDEDAFEMARADDDWHMHDYDWKTGRRNDAPPDKPRSGTNIDSPSTPF